MGAGGLENIVPPAKWRTYKGPWPAPPTRSDSSISICVQGTRRSLLLYSRLTIIGLQSYKNLARRSSNHLILIQRAISPWPKLAITFLVLCRSIHSEKHKIITSQVTIPQSRRKGHKCNQMIANNCQLAQLINHSHAKIPQNWKNVGKIGVD